jgi:hypothetical protein
MAKGSVRGSLTSEEKRKNGLDCVWKGFASQTNDVLEARKFREKESESRAQIAEKQ